VNTNMCKHRGQCTTRGACAVPGEPWTPTAQWAPPKVPKLAAPSESLRPRASFGGPWDDDRQSGGRPFPARLGSPGGTDPTKEGGAALRPTPEEVSQTFGPEAGPNRAGTRPPPVSLRAWVPCRGCTAIWAVAWPEFHGGRRLRPPLVEARLSTARNSQ